MYETHFGLSEAPFSIAPNPHYLYMSAKHREAMAHLLYGIGEGGGFVQLTGEVGTGKTTLCRQLLSELPKDVDVALILNPRIDELELMQSVCDELRIEYGQAPTIKHLLDALNDYLLGAHARGRSTVLIIDEAQNLSAGVLEQVRLLTNLETARRKLLQIILIGQGELRDSLRRRELRQLAQRITARYHLEPLGRREVGEYVRHRLRRAGCDRPLFTRAALGRVHVLSGGVPRLVNVLCDRALLGAWSRGRQRVNRSIASQAGRELAGRAPRRWRRAAAWVAVALMLLAAPVAAYTFGWLPERVDREVRQYVPSWMPRIAIRLEGSTTGWLAAVTGIAHAGEPAPRIAPSLALDEEPRRRRLSAQPLAPVAVETLEQPGREALLSLVSREGGGRVQALRELARLWRIPEDSVFDCVGVGEFGLSCLGAIDSWQELALLDRPAVLALGEEGGPGGFAVLRYLVGDQAVLRVADRDLRASRETIEALWRDSAVIFWRRPPLASIPVNENSPAEDILWLRRAINLEAANYGGATLARVERDLFDTELADALHAFQRRNGLSVRDVAGEVELVVLASRLGYDDHPTLVH